MLKEVSWSVHDKMYMELLYFWIPYTDIIVTPKVLTLDPAALLNDTM